MRRLPTFRSGFAGLALALLYLFLMLPLLVVVASSLTASELMRFPPEGMSLRWYYRFFENGGFMDALALSLKVAAMSTLAATSLAMLAALCQRALSRRLAGWFRILVTLPLLLPELLTSIGLLFFVYRLGLGKSLTGLVIGHVVLSFPFAFLSISAALAQVDPALEEASSSLGASAWTGFRRVLLPLMKPGLLTGALFAFIISFDMFTLSFLLKPIGGNTLPLALFDFLTYDFDPTAAAAAAVSVLIAFVGVFAIDRLVGLRRVG